MIFALSDQGLHCLLPPKNHKAWNDKDGRDFYERMYAYAMSTKVSKGAKIRNRYNQVPNLTQDTNSKVTNSE